MAKSKAQTLIQMDNDDHKDKENLSLSDYDKSDNTITVSNS